MLFGQEHVEKYRDTGGEVGHQWQDGVYTLLLTTTGRTSGEPYTTPLIYAMDGGDYVVIASKGGADDHPDWYRNLVENPTVEIQVGSDVLSATATTVSDDEKQRIWPMMSTIWPAYDEYATKTDREIPVVKLTPKS